MKKIIFLVTLILAVTGVWISSCKKDTAVTPSPDTNTIIPFDETSANSNLGEYYGVVVGSSGFFTLTLTTESSSMALEFENDDDTSEIIQLTSDSKLASGTSIDNLKLTGKNKKGEDVSFSFSVDGNGSEPIINKAVVPGHTVSATCVKRTTKAERPVIFEGVSVRREVTNIDLVRYFTQSVTTTDKDFDKTLFENVVSEYHQKGLAWHDSQLLTTTVHIVLVKNKGNYYTRDYIPGENTSMGGRTVKDKKATKDGEKSRNTGKVSLLIEGGNHYLFQLDNAGGYSGTIVDGKVSFEETYQNDITSDELLGALGNNPDVAKEFDDVAKLIRNIVKIKGKKNIVLGHRKVTYKGYLKKKN